MEKIHHLYWRAGFGLSPREWQANQNLAPQQAVGRLFQEAGVINENFARELLELFTIGRGHYTEQDIKEAARAFTGWSSNLTGDFTFHTRLHDYGSKTFFGKTGNFDGTDIVDLILEQRETARFITRKIYRYFVNEKVDEARVETLSRQFYESGYEITPLLRSILESDWFYASENIGGRRHIKNHTSKATEGSPASAG